MHRLLRTLAGPELADSIAGDLAEERARQESRVGPARAAVWYWRASLAIGGHMVRRRISEMARDGLSVLRPGRGRGEFRSAARSLRRSPWYAVTIIGIIAMSITLATTVFAVVDGVLFRPLPYPDAQDVFALSGVFNAEPPGPPERLVRTVSPKEVNAWSPAVPSVPITLLGYTSLLLEDGTRASATMIDRRFLEVFGVRLLIGGFDGTHFEAQGAHRPIIISHALWLSKFDGDPSIVGHTFSPPDFRPGVPRLVYTVVGVLDADGFVPPLPGSPDDWVRRENRVDALIPNTLSATFGERIGTAFARIPPGRVSATESALREAVLAFRSTATPVPPRATRGQRLALAPYDGVTLEPLSRLLTTRQRPILTLVFATTIGLTLLVLLNAAALATARAQRRLPELAVRRALGARTRDLLRSALVEQALLVAAGTAIGIAIAPSFLDVVARQLPQGLSLIKDARIDWRAAGFAVVVAAALTTAVAMLSVRYAVRHAPPGAAMASRHGRSPAQARFSRLLVSSQIAVAFGLVLGGVMFITSLGLIWREDVGMRSHDAAVLGIRFDTPVSTDRISELARTLRRMPGITAAGAMDLSILNNVKQTSSFFSGPDGKPPGEPVPTLVQVGAGFFDAADIRLLEGRLPTDAELEAGAPVIAISDTLAKRYWPAGDAVGFTLRAGSRPVHTVVGIVRDARIVAWDVASDGMIFGSQALTRFILGGYVFLALDAFKPPALTDIASYLTQIDPAVRVSTFRPIDEALAESIRPRRISALTAGAFSLAAVALVMLGLFGLVAQTTGWRTREMGVRLALGDTPAGIVWRVLLEPLGAVGAGILAGGVAAAVAARAIGTYLYGIAPYDAGAWAAAALVMLATTALGAMVPALRAGRVNVVTALRDGEGI